MEHIHELLALGVDVLVLGICIAEYRRNSRTVTALKNAPELPLDNVLHARVLAQQGQKIPYAVIRGTVSPIGVPMKSVMTPSVTGVLQAMKLSEHVMARGFAGFWQEHRKLIHSSYNDVPFKISSPEVGVEVIDALSAQILDMDVIYDNYEPSSLSIFDHLFGFFSGVRQRGMQVTEEILRDGSYITAVGEISMDNNSLRIQSSGNGPLFLTTATKGSLIKKFQEAKSIMGTKIFICGAIAALFVGIIGRRLWKRHRQQIIARADRHRRRARARTNVPAEQRCVVCVTNPKEVILLPCGHVCICEDCSYKIKSKCPVCRTDIESRTAAYIA